MTLRRELSALDSFGFREALERRAVQSGMRLPISNGTLRGRRPRSREKGLHPRGKAPGLDRLE